MKLALRRVKDPELNLNILDLGLVYDIRVDGNAVSIDMTLTSPGLPVGSRDHDRRRTTPQGDSGRRRRGGEPRVVAVLEPGADRADECARISGSDIRTRMPRFAGRHS